MLRTDIKTDIINFYEDLFCLENGVKIIRKEFILYSKDILSDLDFIIECIHSIDYKPQGLKFHDNNFTGYVESDEENYHEVLGGNISIMKASKESDYNIYYFYFIMRA